MNLLIASVYVTNIKWILNEIKQKFHHFVFVLNKILGGNELRLKVINMQCEIVAGL